MGSRKQTAIAAAAGDSPRTVQKKKHPLGPPYPWLRTSGTYTRSRPQQEPGQQEFTGAPSTNTPWHRVQRALAHPVDSEVGKMQTEATRRTVWCLPRLVPLASTSWSSLLIPRFLCALLPMKFSRPREAAARWNRVLFVGLLPFQLSTVNILAYCMLTLNVACSQYKRRYRSGDSPNLSYSVEEAMSIPPNAAVRMREVANCRRTPRNSR